MITTTDVGLSAIRAADQGGFLLNITHFSVTDAIDPVIGTGDTDLSKPAYYSGYIESIEPVGTNTVKFIVTVPPGVPASGTVSISEIGIYLVSGELFAHGSLETPFVKDPSFGLSFHVYVTAARLGEVINVTIVNTSSLPVINRVSRLPNPVESNASAVIVLDSLLSDDGAACASMALRYGPGGSLWAFNDRRRTFYGNPDSVVSQASFILDVTMYEDAWLNDKEEVIVQAVTAGVPGLSRRCVYTKAGHVFTTVDEPFQGLAASSMIAVWRHNSQTLPKRDPALPELSVLVHGTKRLAPTPADTSGHGLRTTQGTVITSVPFPVGLEHAPIDINFAGFPVPIPAAVGRTMVFATIFAGSPLPDDPVSLGGKWLSPGQYTVTGTIIRVLDRSVIRDCLRMTLVTITDEPGYEGTLSVVESEYQQVVAQTVFTLPAIVFNEEHAMMFINGVLVPNSYWNLNPGGYSVTTSHAVTAASVKIMLFVPEDVLSASPGSFLQTFSITQPNQFVVLTNTPPGKQNLFCLYNGRPTTRFTFTPTGLTLQEPLQSAADTFVVYSFDYAAASLAVANPRLTSPDRGPYWAHPDTISTVYWADAADYNQWATEINRIMCDPNGQPFPDNMGYAQNPIPLLDLSRHVSPTDWAVLFNKRHAMGYHVGDNIVDDMAERGITEFVYKSSVIGRSLRKVAEDFDDFRSATSHVLSAHNDEHGPNYDLQVFDLGAYNGPFNAVRHFSFAFVFQSLAHAQGQVNAGMHLKLGAEFSTASYPADLAAWNTFLDQVGTIDFSRSGATAGRPFSGPIYGLCDVLNSTNFISWQLRYTTAQAYDIAMNIGMVSNGAGRIDCQVSYDNTAATTYGQYASGGSQDFILLDTLIALTVPNGWYLNDPHIGFPVFVPGASGA